MDAFIVKEKKMHRIKSNKVYLIVKNIFFTQKSF